MADMHEGGTKLWQILVAAGVVGICWLIATGLVAYAVLSYFQS